MPCWSFGRGPQLCHIDSIPTAVASVSVQSGYRRVLEDQIGSGLGLSIVKAVADSVGASVTLGFGDESRQSGLRVAVIVPSQLVSQIEVESSEI